MNAIKKATDKFEYLSLKALDNLSNFFKSLKGILLSSITVFFSKTFIYNCQRNAPSTNSQT